MDQFREKIVYNHPEGNTYPVLIHGKLAAPRRTSAKVKGVPQKMDFEILHRQLEPFGKVKRISRLRVDGVYKVVTARVNATMVLAPNKNTPSFLTLEGRKFRVYYPGQPPTCMICSSPEHLSINCQPSRRTRCEDTTVTSQQQQQKQQEQQEQQQKQLEQEQQQQQRQQPQQQEA
jgi:hypothetical protein